MSTDIDAIDSDDLSDYTNWMLETGLWDGRPVSWTEAADFEREVEQKIVQLLFSQGTSSAAFDQMAANFAWLGTDPSHRSLLARDIQSLILSPNGEIIQAGFCKSVSKFWKKHKAEILIGIGVLAVITTIVVVSVCTGGTGASAAAVGGAAALGSLTKRKDDRDDDIALTPNPIPDVKGKTVFLEKGVMVDGQYTSYQDILQRGKLEEMLAARDSVPAELVEPLPPHPQPPPIATTPPPLPRPEKSWAYDFFETVGREILEVPSNDPDYPVDPIQTSSFFTTEGVRDPRCRIGGINGMNTSLDKAKDHARYLQSFTLNQSIDWVYNHSNGPVIDLAEVFFMNYLGSSPNTGKLMREQWTAFHEENRDNPNAKYLQFCYSQGTIEVRNELVNAPEEIRDRVIVVAIAPGAIVPEDICYKSFNYASKNDVVPLGEMAFYGALDSNEVGISKPLERAVEHHKQLILLEPHPDATGIDHDFQSPTFKKEIEKHIKDYLARNGEYE